MENEEKEDLLVDVTGSEIEVCDKEEEIDHYIREKILDFIEKEKQTPRSDKRTLIIITCLLIFLSSSSLVVVFPIYTKFSAANKITTYGKLVTLSSANAFLFGIVHLIRLIPKWDCQSSPRSPFSILDVIKISLLFAAGNVSLFCLIDGSYIRCHLEDPLKGSSILFSLLFYYLLSKKKMSVERTFCAITIIVGVFVSVDFGICDKFRCNGSSEKSESTPKFHFLFLILYLIAHGIWVLHLTLIEVCWTTSKDFATALNESIFSKFFAPEDSQENNLKESIQSLSIICQDEDVQSGAKIQSPGKSIGNIKAASLKYPNGDKTRSIKSFERSLENSLARLSRLSSCNLKRFPVTSTPKNGEKGFQSWSSVRLFDVALWQHITCLIVILGFCWWETVPFLNEGEAKLLADVVSDVFESIRCHLGWSSHFRCKLTPSIAFAFSVSYAVLILSSLELLKMVQSAVTVIAIMMPALPVSSLFWSLFRISDNSYDVLEFNPEITGEAVCAILGLPILGIGIVLLLKSHVREFIISV